jgi:hypothetical protein
MSPLGLIPVATGCEIVVDKCNGIDDFGDSERWPKSRSRQKRGAEWRKVEQQLAALAGSNHNGPVKAKTWVVF